MTNDNYDIICIKRGPDYRLPHLLDGEVVFLPNIRQFAVGTEVGNVIVGADKATIGDIIVPTFVEQQDINSLICRDVGPVRYFIFQKFKLYKLDERNLKSISNINLGSFPIPLGDVNAIINGKIFTLSIAIDGTDILAYSHTDIAEYNLIIGNAVSISGNFSIPL